MRIEILCTFLLRDGLLLNQNSAGLVGHHMYGTLTFTNMAKDAVDDFSVYRYTTSKDAQGNTVVKWILCEAASTLASGYVGCVENVAIAWIDFDEQYLPETEGTYTILPEDVYTNKNGYYAIRPGNKGYFNNKNYLNKFLP